MTITNPSPEASNASALNATVDLPTLKRALAAVKPAIPSRGSALPILFGVKLEAGEGGLTITTTDLDLSAVVVVAAEVSSPGTAIVDHKSLAAVVSGKGSVVLEGSAFVLTVRTPSGPTSSLPLLSVTEYPSRLFDVAEPVASFALPIAAIGDVIAAACKEDHLPVISAVYVHGSQLAATDRYRLHVVNLPDELPTPEPVLIPARALREVVKATKGSGEASFTVYPRCVRIDVDGRTLTSRLIEGEFPRFGQLIPDMGGTVATFDLAGMQKVAEGFAKLAGPKSPDPMILPPVDGGGLEVSFHSSTTDQESAVTVAGSIDERMGLTPRYFGPILDGMGAGATVETWGALKPLKVSDTRDGWDVVRLLMPVRIK